MRQQNVLLRTQHFQLHSLSVSPLRVYRLIGLLVATVVLLGGLHGVNAPVAHAGEIRLQGVIVRWDDNLFVKPTGCGNYAIDWTNGSGRRLLMIRVQVMRSNDISLFWQSQIPALPGQSGTFNQVICDSRLSDGLGPYRVDLTIEDYGGASFVASAPLTFLSTAPAPAPGAAPGAATRAPKRPSSIRVKLTGTTANVSWREAPLAQQVTGYEVTAYPGGKACKTKKNACSIKGLKRGSEFQFTVVALNPVGSSPAAKSKVIRVPQARQERPTPAPRPTRPPPPPPKPAPELT